jgi:hypothetical protein
MDGLHLHYGDSSLRRQRGQFHSHGGAADDGNAARINRPNYPALDRAHDTRQRPRPGR